MKLILASSSPRRKRLMNRLNCSFDIIFPDVDESKMQFESSPEKYCISLAELKADNVSQDHPNALVIGADTIVVLNDNIMNKPHDHNEAEEMLHTLSGKIPESISNLVNLTQLSLAHNSLIDSIPVTIGNLQSLIVQIPVQQ